MKKLAIALLLLPLAPGPALLSAARRQQVGTLLTLAELDHLFETK